MTWLQVADNMVEHPMAMSCIFGHRHIKHLLQAASAVPVAAVHRVPGCERFYKV